MNRKNILVVGSGFAGLTAAIELKRQLGERHDITVLSKSDRFVFAPSLIQVPFGLRSKEGVTFDVRERLEKHGLRFRQAEVTRLDLENRIVTTKSGEERYDRLLLATGSNPNYAAIPGLGPRGYTQSILTLAEAEKARAAFERLVAAPGPVVVGHVQGGPCACFAYEFLFHMGRELKLRGLSGQAPLFHLDPGSPLEGLDTDAAEVAGHLMERLGVQALTNATIRQAGPKEIVLADGRRVPFAYAMVVPTFLGVDAVRACERITDASGFVRVDAHFQTPVYPDVFAAGAAAAPDPTRRPLACGAATNGSFSEESARTAACNLAASIEDRAMIELPTASVDTRSMATRDPNGAIPVDDRLEKRDHDWFLTGPEAQWAKSAFERYFPAPDGDAGS